MSETYSLIDFLKTFGVNTTTNFDLYSIAKFLDIPLEIYMKNEDFSILPNMNYIFNYQNSNQNGTHWVAFKNGYYFDSFGLKPLDQISGVKVYNKIQVQHFNTEICGILCIYFLYKMEQSEKFDTIISEMKNLYKEIAKKDP